MVGICDVVTVNALLDVTFTVGIWFRGIVRGSRVEPPTEAPLKFIRTTNTVKNQIRCIATE